MTACRCRTCIETRDGAWALAQTFVVCSHCGNKRCPKADHHEFACTGSNEPGQVGVLEADQPPAPAPDPADLELVARLYPFLKQIKEAGGEDADLEADLAEAFGLVDWCRELQRFSGDVPALTSDTNAVKKLATEFLPDFDAWGYRLLHQGGTSYVVASLFKPATVAKGWSSEIAARGATDALAMLGAVVIAAMRVRGYTGDA